MFRLTPGKLLVDKNPLSLNALPLINRLFPDAKIILALRHPCDVVLSCYITWNFKLNDAMSNFLRLDTAAELYDLSFSYFEKARELIGLPVHSRLRRRGGRSPTGIAGAPLIFLSSARATGPRP